MPPKKGNDASKKTVEKEKKKIIEDKTFGLKNKKGAKQQKFVQHVQKQVTFGNKSQREIDKAQLEKQNKKDEKKNAIDELGALFKPVAELQKIGKGVDPKSVLCAFFKQGTCTKGDKCKFSHDMSIERKSEKKNLYEDDRKEMETWNQDELEDVINTKHGASNKGLPPTTIICKYFLDAVEVGKYGWFWECPNGAGCHYKHALPANFVLKKDKKKMEEQKETISLEELIETERRNLSINQTKVTLLTFLAWKKRKRAEKLAAANAAKAKKQANFTQGRIVGISGREMFEFNPEFVDEGEDLDGDVCMDREEDEEGQEYDVRDIDLNAFDIIDQGDNDGSSEPKTSTSHKDVAIDEELFNDDELEGLDDELEDLDVNS